MKGRFNNSLKQLHKDLEKYRYFCNNLCKGETPINNTTCHECKLYIEKKVKNND